METGDLNKSDVSALKVCDLSVESSLAVLPCGTVHYAVQGGSNFRVCE